MDDLRDEAQEDLESAEDLMLYTVEAREEYRSGSDSWGEEESIWPEDEYGNLCTMDGAEELDFNE